MAIHRKYGPFGHYEFRESMWSCQRRALTYREVAVKGREKGKKSIFISYVWSWTASTRVKALALCMAAPLWSQHHIWSSVSAVRNGQVRPPKQKDVSFLTFKKKWIFFFKEKGVFFSLGKVSSQAFFNSKYVSWWNSNRVLEVSAT